MAKRVMPTPRGQSVTIAGDDGWIYVIGGVSIANGTALATVEAYDHVTDSWITMSSLPNATMGASGAKALDGTIYVISGSGTIQERQGRLFITPTSSPAGEDLALVIDFG